MIGYFQYRAGTGGYFFIRALLYRYGYTDKPTPSSYWNEYHIPAEYSFPNFKKIPWHDTYGHKWYNWETGIGSTYKSERVKTYLVGQKQLWLDRIDSDCFIIDHQLYPNLKDTFNEVFPEHKNKLATFSISTLNEDFAKFTKAVNDIKSKHKECYKILGKDHAVYETGNFLDQREDVVRSDRFEICHNKIDVRRMMRQHQNEQQYCDYFLDAEKILQGDSETWEIVDNFYKKDSVLQKELFRDLCQNYLQKNQELYDKYRVFDEH